jgi:ATP-dependent DNA helicase RecG
MTNINSSLSEIPSAKRFIPKLKKLNILTLNDLLSHLPRRYEDFSDIKNVSELKPNQESAAKVKITNSYIYRPWKTKLFIFEITAEDKSGSIKAVWFNQPYLTKILKKGKVVYLAGKTSLRKKELIFSNPIYELEKKNQEMIHSGRIIPIYPETKGLTSRGLRYLIEKALKEVESIPEIIPEDIRKKINIPEINSAIRQIHFPENNKEIKKAQKRFAFEDLFILQLSNLKKRYAFSKKNAPKIETNKKKIFEIENSLPFKLTEDQETALKEIIIDLQSGYPMNRLLQGDVGSGKTIIAAIASIITAENSFQSAFMAPTEILARQHYENFKKIFNNFEEGVALLTSDESKIFFGEGMESNPNKKSLLEKIKKDKIKIVIGTHALIQKNVSFSNLGLVIIDEQHRFGVEQRAKLVENKEKIPHLLSMTATPIPRTLAITAFGDLDISSIIELPKNRKRVITKIVSPDKREKAYQFIRQEVKKERQVFVVCPRIEQSEGNGEEKDKRKSSWDDVKAVKDEYKKLSKEIFSQLKVEMLHGKIKPEEKEKIMKKMREGKIDILVSTSVVEVGIDIPNATIMMIEGAERFGLAQLYQFKGRVGRGAHQSYCLLFSDSNSPETKKRLHSITEAKNGFELAEKDLEIRGPGQFLGKSQAGIPDHVMRALQKPILIKESQKSAKEIIKKDPLLKKHPHLQKKVNSLEDKIHRE